MDISTAHAAAVVAAIRIPALQARLDLLVGDAENRARIEFHGGEYPEPAGAGTPTPIVVLNLSAGAGYIDELEFRLVISTPLEAQITGADPANGTIPTWARYFTPAGAWFGDATVSVTGGGGEIQLPQTGVEGGNPVVRWYNGAFARITSAYIQG